MAQIETNDAVSIRDYFQELEDPRSTINQRHLLEDVVVIAILAVIAGADGPKAIGVWAKAHEEWLRRYLPLPGGIPSHDTIGRVLAALRPEAFQECFQRWVASLDRTETTETEEIIAIDGKALRRSHDRRRHLGPLFLVSAWAVRGGMSLGQLATEEKSNEITAIPKLIDQIHTDKAIVTIDAAGCQRNIAAKIVDGGGDYVLALKGNQESLHEAVREYLARHMENDFADVPARRFEETVAGHGRLDTLTYYQVRVPAKLAGVNRWKGLRTIGVAIRHSHRDGEQTTDVRFYISSLRLSVKRFAASVRGHWGIENTLHWCLDVTFREDESRLRNRFAADNLARLKRFAITLLKRQPDKETIAMRRRMAGWNIDYLAQVVGLKRI